MPTELVNGIKLNYQIQGDGDPLVFIHGLGSSLQDWEYQTAFFSQHDSVLTLDLRGHGESGKPNEKYSMAGFSADIATLLEKINHQPAHIVGLSLGGMVAYQFALDYPHLVKSLVIVNSLPALVPDSFKDWLMLGQRSLLTAILSMRRIGEFLAPRLFPNENQAHLREMMVERWAKNDKRAYLRSFAAILNWSIADRLGEITAPTLIVASDNDYTPVADKERYLEQMPNAELVVIADAHHAVPIEHPQQFNAILAAFLSQQKEQG